MSIPPNQFRRDHPWTKRVQGWSRLNWLGGIFILINCQCPIRPYDALPIRCKVYNFHIFAYNFQITDVFRNKFRGAGTLRKDEDLFFKINFRNREFDQFVCQRYVKTFLCILIFKQAGRLILFAIFTTGTVLPFRRAVALYPF